MSEANNPQIPAHIQDFDKKLGATSLTILSSRPPVDPEVYARSLEKTCPVDVVQQVERRITQIERRLEAADGFEPTTGRPAFHVPEGSDLRKKLEIELHFLRSQTLPLARQQAAEIAAAKAALPTPEERAAAEFERAARIEARARELVEELEAKQKAERLLAERNRGRAI